MEDRFNFNAIVTGYYTNDKDEETEVQIYLQNVTLCSGGDIIGIESYVLIDALKEQHPELSREEVQQIIISFEDNSETCDNNFDYLAIKPDKILQCTGLKESSGILLYEGDKVYLRNQECTIKYVNGHYMLHNLSTLQCSELTSSLLEKLTIKSNVCTCT